MERQEFLEKSDDELRAMGTHIATRMSPEELVRWACRILESAARAGVRTEVVDGLVQAIGDEERWLECKDVFHALRSETLAEEKRGSPEGARSALLLLAENIAKSAYNATHPQAPFDADSSVWIPLCVQHLCRNLEDESVVQELVSLISSANR